MLCGVCHQCPLHAGAKVQDLPLQRAQGTHRQGSKEAVIHRHGADAGVALDRAGHLEGRPVGGLGGRSGQLRPDRAGLIGMVEGQPKRQGVADLVLELAIPYPIAEKKYLQRLPALRRIGRAVHVRGVRNHRGEDFRQPLERQRGRPGPARLLPLREGRMHRGRHLVAGQAPGGRIRGRLPGGKLEVINRGHVSIHPFC